MGNKHVQPSLSDFEQYVANIRQLKETMDNTERKVNLTTRLTLFRQIHDLDSFYVWYVNNMHSLYHYTLQHINMNIVWNTALKYHKILASPIGYYVMEAMKQSVKDVSGQIQFFPDPQPTIRYWNGKSRDYIKQLMSPYSITDIKWFFRHKLLDIGFEAIRITLSTNFEHCYCIHIDDYDDDVWTKIKLGLEIVSELPMYILDIKIECGTYRNHNIYNPDRSAYKICAIDCTPLTQRFIFKTKEEFETFIYNPKPVEFPASAHETHETKTDPTSSFQSCQSCIPSAPIGELNDSVNKVNIVQQGEPD